MHPAEILKLKTPELSVLNRNQSIDEYQNALNEYLQQQSKYSSVYNSGPSRWNLSVNLHIEFVRLKQAGLKARKAKQNVVIDKEPAIMAMEAIVLMILDFFGIDWKEMQIRETAEIIINDYHWLKFAEIKQFLQRIKSGYFGEVYGGFHRFSPPVLFSWLAQYAEESKREREALFHESASAATFDERWSNDGKHYRQIANEEQTKYIESLRKRFSGNDDEE